MYVIVNQWNNVMTFLYHCNIMAGNFWCKEVESQSENRFVITRQCLTRWYINFFQNSFLTTKKMNKSLTRIFTKLCASWRVWWGAFKVWSEKEAWKQDCDCWRMPSKLMLPEFLFPKLNIIRLLRLQECILQIRGTSI